MIEIADTTTGRMMYDSNDIWIGGSLKALGEYSYHEAKAVQKFCRPNTVAIDVGANIGALTIPMSEAVGDKGIVIACEPQHLVWQILVGNVALNSKRNIIPLNVAVGKKPGSIICPELLESDGKVNSGGLELGKHRDGRKVPMATVDSLVLKDQPVSLIKIDVEGMEPDVILGAMNTIELHRPVVYFEADRDNYKKSVMLLHQQGYRCYTHQPPMYREENHKGAGNPWDGKMVSFNVVAMPDDTDPELEHGMNEIIVRNTDGSLSV